MLSQILESNVSEETDDILMYFYVETFVNEVKYYQHAISAMNRKWTEF